MLSAMRQGLERGYETFVFYGGTGGREDHTIANIQLLFRLASMGKRGYLIGKQNVLTAICDSEIRFQNRSGYLSVFCAGDCAKGVTISGCKYNLQDGELTNLYPIGVSNEIVEPKARITIRKGTLICVIARKE